MIKCSHCGSYDIVDTQRVLTTYPPQYVYKCNECGKQFIVSYEKHLDLDKSEDVTCIMADEIIKNILALGEIPTSVYFYSNPYSFHLCKNNKYYYVHDRELIHVNLPKEFINEAEELYNQKVGFYKKLYSYASQYRSINAY